MAYGAKKASVAQDPPGPNNLPSEGTVSTTGRRTQLLLHKRHGKEKGGEAMGVEEKLRKGFRLYIRYLQEPFSLQADWGLYTPNEICLASKD